MVSKTLIVCVYKTRNLPHTPGYNPKTTTMWQGPYQDVHFSLILCYVAKINPHLYKFSLYLESISSKYEAGDIHLLPVLQGEVIL